MRLMQHIALPAFAGRRALMAAAVASAGLWLPAAHAVASNDAVAVTAPIAIKSAAGDCRNRPAPAGWPAWDRFAASFMADGARVIDPGTPNGQTTSEGQAYALFFALVADDRPRFERILRWTEDNLAGGDLGARLPAWLWGKKSDGTWGVIDDNPASDADLWIAYALQEAGRLWQLPHYGALGQLLAERILREESTVVDGLGRVLLPAPKGFMPMPDTVRLNPSYVPLQVLRRLAAGSIGAESKAQWMAQLASTQRMIIDSAPRGFAPDWVLYQSGKGFRADEQTAGVGSFNAIRTYLWAGMLAPGEPYRAALAKALTPMLAATQKNGTPPQQVDTRSGAITGIGDAGFSAALLPLLSSRSGANANAAVLQRTRITANDPLARRDNYYEQTLTLFGLGWADGRYRFKQDGMLERGTRCNAR